MTISYTLATTYYNMFLFVNDSLNTKLAAFIISGTLIASCNGGAMTVSTTGYFTSSNCTTALSITNTITGAIIFSITTFTPTIIYTVKLNRFVMPQV